MRAQVCVAKRNLIANLGVGRVFDLFFRHAFICADSCFHRSRPFEDEDKAYRAAAEARCVRKSFEETISNIFQLFLL